MPSNPFTAVANSMTEDARIAAMEFAFRMNPQLRGAHMDDLLEMYYDNDAMLNLTEPVWEMRNDELVQNVPAPYLSAAALAVGLLLQQPNRFTTIDILTVELLAVAAANADGVHGSVGGEGREGVAAHEGDPTGGNFGAGDKP